MTMVETPQSEAIKIVIDKLKSELGCNIIIGPLPEGGGITAEINNGTGKGRYLNNKHGKEQLTVLFLCKNSSQNTAYNTLCTIGNVLDAFTPLEGENVHISGAETRSGAGLVGNDGGYYIYSMIAGINIVF